MSEIELRVLSQADWKIYKSLRLASLVESPDAFGSTYEREAEHPDEEWKSRLDPIGRAANALPIIAYLNGAPSGLAWALVHNPETKVAHIYQMWVSPEARGLGAGRALIIHIISWARKSKLKSLSLGVTTTNSAAVALYRASGFVPSGKFEELRLGSPLRTQLMNLDLHSNDA